MYVSLLNAFVDVQRLPPTYAARRLLCTAQSIDLCTFHRVSDQALQEMMQKFEQLEQLEIPGFDVSEQDGVLELSLGEKGTYAINKQCQNRQIWWSSPVSGPKRYCYDSTLKAWKSTRDGHLMYDLLNQELSELLQIPFDIYTVASKPSVMTSESSRQQQ
ncbi:frataxin, mitochondrial-like [Schistocerca gregaria]|uniref:frataxin, mitochondrial-like n=1 Tax=Schistocerca gregaria TaxID=7010 RepID=UPI00211F089F|nr:frataxin, mitochondrial-like [Schistocerca gregaria]